MKEALTLVKIAIHCCAMKRRYELKERARRQAETRQRIVEATVELHTTIGSARTTISAIAERAGVERHTVYAHFPDEAALFRACSMHWRGQHPRPDVQRWLQLDVPEQRLRGVLSDLYAWYDDVESDFEVLRRDASLVPAHAESMAEGDEATRALADTLARGWPRRKTVRAAIGHALEFESWRSLVRRQGLSRKQAVDAMLRLTESA
jgi:AcrR family transcriptional regulator